MAGEAGFEPTITGPKPVALPLGHSPNTKFVKTKLKCKLKCGSNYIKKYIKLTDKINNFN